MIEIREATDSDFDAIWDIFHRVVKKGDTYAFNTDTGKDEVHNIWMKEPKVTFVAISEGRIVGTYYIKPNHGGGGAHVCNAGFMVHPENQGQSVGRAMGNTP